MALRISAAMAICLLFSLVAIAHSIPLKEASLSHTTNASSAAATAAAEKVHAVPDGEEPLHILTYIDHVVLPDEVEEALEHVAEPDPDRSLPSSDGEEVEEALEHVAEPDPDRSIPSIDGGEEEELMDKKRQAAEGQQGDEKTEEKIEDEVGNDNKEKEKQHGCDGKGKKEKKIKKHRRSNEDDDEEEEEETKKQIHRHRRVEKKMKKRPHHSKYNNGDDSDDEDDEQEKKERRWRKKAISRSMFGHGRRSQREEAAKDEVKN